MNEPLVSVIIPTYNRAEVICETIENIFQQTYPNLELIVVDDGSTDDTPSVLRSYGNRIRWAAQENAGPSAARNRGISMAKGEVIAFQDSDDAWHPTKIERQVSLLQRGGESVVCCLCNCNVERDGRVVHSFETAPIYPPIEEGMWLNVTEVLATRCVLFNQAVAVRRKALVRVGGFDESFRLMEDMELALRLSLEGPWTFIREPLATRQAKLRHTLSHEASEIIVAKNVVRIQEGILRIIESSGRLAALRPQLERELRRSRRFLRAAQMKESDVFGASLVGWVLERTEHYRQAAYRRTPWFPQMKVSALDSRNFWDLRKASASEPSLR
ncbi:Glycosyl transferase family 2 [Candidatus Sulfotelmatobacter kueseliae]|uniref:Glycosyl transferase family 2 n=1 Tax=Candidatus Sulfotelmatobacter kueseliae TaxID=2042962 RepID=A0A2U3KKI1_9BACT|nr:Glycosyl transferase family 2 [Candidatus Sulfotelmatobacter kueseliae]